MPRSARVFVESRTMFSIYTRDGEQVLVPHKTYPIEYDPDDVTELWNTNYANRVSLSRAKLDFKRWLRSVLEIPDLADDLTWCNDCEEPGLKEDYCCVQDDGYVCEPCRDNSYYYCDQCETWDNSCNSTNEDMTVCDRCLHNGFRWCDDCEAYYFSNSDCDHDEGSGCCESPALEFAIRNDGVEPLKQDTRVKIGLPAGVITDEGLYHMKQQVYGWGGERAMRMVDEIGAIWQTKEGNWTKRFSRQYHKKHQVAVPPEVLSSIGNIAKANSDGNDFEIEITRNLNLSARDFGHADSCWWQSYYASRCALKTNGGFGIRSFDAHDRVTGRAWVLPLKRTEPGMPGLTPTFDTENCDAFMVFNCYGALSGYSPARILTHMAGWTYRKISFGCDPMYVNENRGYLVAPEDIATFYTDGNLCLSVDQHADLYAIEQTKELCHVA